MFSIRTGAAHPRPEQSVLYPVGTSYATLRDNTAQEIWTNAGTIVNTDIAPYVFRSMQDAPAVDVDRESADRISRDLRAAELDACSTTFVVSGTSLADTRVRHSITITNAVAGVALVRPAQPVGLGPRRHRRAALSHAESDRALYANVLRADGAGIPGVRAGGRYRDADVSRVRDRARRAVEPDAPGPLRLRRVAWNCSKRPWDTPIIGEELDSATVYYWGFVIPLTLAPGASATFTQYASTAASAIGIAPDVAAEVPALSHLASAILALMLLALAMSAHQWLSTSHNARCFVPVPAGGDGPPRGARLNSHPMKKVQRRRSSSAADARGRLFHRLSRAASASSPRRRPRTCPAPRC